MKLTKRMKSSLIQVNITHVFLLGVFMCVIMLFCIPRINIIENQKEELMVKYEHLQKIQKLGLSYGDLKMQLSEAGTQDSYTKTLLARVDEDFYDTHFLSPGDQAHSDFLSEIETKILLVKDSAEYKERESIFNRVLPYYNSGDSLDGEGLTDFHFVNYVEKLLYTFNLQSQGDIGVGKIERVEKIELKESLLEEDIYKIPLDFKVIGRKGDTFEFLHFLENVGGIDIEEGKTMVYQDQFIKKVFQGDDLVDEYNIYTNQLVDVESLSISEYPDSSSIKSELDLVARMKGEQSREKIEIDISLNFYVAGLPGYKMEGYITGFLLDYDTLLKEILSTQQEYKAKIYDLSEGKQIQAVSTLESLVRIMESLEEDILDIRKQLASREGIEDLYDKVVDYNKQLEQIRKKFSEQKDLLIK